MLTCIMSSFVCYTRKHNLSLECSNNHLTIYNYSRLYTLIILSLLEVHKQAVNKYVLNIFLSENYIGQNY